MTSGLDRRVQTAHADAWEAEGRLREPYGGGVLEARGLRLMASGLSSPELNGGDVTAPDPDLLAARAFYARHEVAWGLRVPASMPWTHGRRILSLRLMAVETGALGAPRAAPGVDVRRARPADLDTVAAIDAAAFGGEPAAVRPWIGPHLSAPAVTTALATLDAEPAGTGFAILTDGRAGACVYVGGVAVDPGARRRGVATALSAWLLERGFAAGARLGHLQTDTDEAARVYARLGLAEFEPLDVYVGI